MYGSQTYDDNNEGFDVTIDEEAGRGKYWLIIVWPEGAKGCDGATDEPAELVWAW